MRSLLQYKMHVSVQSLISLASGKPLNTYKKSWRIVGLNNIDVNDYVNYFKEISPKVYIFSKRKKVTYIVT